MTDFEVSYLNAKVRLQSNLSFTTRKGSPKTFVLLRLSYNSDFHFSDLVRKHLVGFLSSYLATLSIPGIN